MVSYFNDKPGELPGGDQRGPPTDVTSWWSIYSSAKRLINSCLKSEKKFGWVQIGMLFPPSHAFMDCASLKSTLSLA